MIPQLLGLGDAALDAEIDGFLLKAPNPSSSQVADFLKLYSQGESRDAAAKALIAKGVDSNSVSLALNWLETSGNFKWNAVWGVAAMGSAAACAYHGYKRNNSLWWAFLWSLAGGAFPLFSVAVAAAQGFGKKKGS